MAALRALHPDREARGYSQKRAADATQNRLDPHRSPDKRIIGPKTAGNGKKPTLRGFAAGIFLA